MGMHEIENLVKESINCLKKSHKKDLDFDSIAYTLYDFQSWWDTGPSPTDLKPAKLLDLKKVVWKIIVEAEKQKNIQLISQWYPIFPMTFANDQNPPDDKTSKAIRDIIIRTKAYTINNDYGYTELPDEKTLKELSQKSKFYAWWYEPLKNYYHSKKHNFEYWLKKSDDLIVELKDMKRVIDKGWVQMAQKISQVSDQEIQKNLDKKYQEVLDAINQGLTLKKDPRFYRNEKIAHDIMENEQ